MVGIEAPSFVLVSDPGVADATAFGKPVHAPHHGGDLDLMTSSHPFLVAPAATTCNPAHG